jgi:CBS domain-containing membrane protein
LETSNASIDDPRKDGTYTTTIDVGGAEQREGVPVRLSWLALRRWAGIGHEPATHVEKWLSTAGGLAGILGVALITRSQLGLAGSAGIIASMGSSAVLLFAVPHGPLSQPWSVLGGHLVSAIVGVTCAKWIPEPMLAAAVAVALAIGAMHYLRCIHPPGGATALGAVVGGDVIHELGYQFVVTPVMLNATTILLVALLFNAPFAWRRYPLAWAARSGAKVPLRTASDDAALMGSGDGR